MLAAAVAVAVAVASGWLDRVARAFAARHAADLISYVCAFAIRRLGDGVRLAGAVLAGAPSNHRIRDLLHETHHLRPFSRRLCATVYERDGLDFGSLTFETLQQVKDSSVESRALLSPEIGWHAVTDQDDSVGRGLHCEREFQGRVRVRGFLRVCLPPIHLFYCFQQVFASCMQVFLARYPVALARYVHHGPAGELSRDLVGVPDEAEVLRWRETLVAPVGV